MKGDKEILKRVTPMEIAACAASHYCENGMTVFVGVGLSLLPAQLAQRTKSPDIAIVYEGGSIGATPVGRVPWGIDDTVIQVNAECETDVITTLGCMAQGGIADKVDYRTTTRKE